MILSFETLNVKPFGILNFIFKKLKIKTNEFKLNLNQKVLLILISILFLFGFANLTGRYLTDARTSVNIGRLGSNEAETLIMNLMHNSSVFTDIINWLTGWIILLFPVPYLNNFSYLQWGFIIWNLINLMIFLKLIKYQNKTTKIDYSTKWCIAWIIAFSATQGIFEPDLGSYVKHLIVILPMYFYLLFTFEKRISKNNLED
jgi:hypothetical protein